MGWITLAFAYVMPAVGWIVYAAGGKSVKKINFKRIAAVIYAVVIIAMAFLFFTNDFGLVDIRKTAVIIGAGIDLTQDGISVTAQVAIPQPSENGESTQYIEVEGEGVTVADALNEINKRRVSTPSSCSASF